MGGHGVHKGEDVKGSSTREIEMVGRVEGSGPITDKYGVLSRIHNEGVP